jgi:hypothetical protein
MVNDSEILAAVRTMVEQEHELRARMEAGSLDPADEQARLRQLEESLDQCWDLLRQRRARRDAGQDPDDAQARDVSTVEGYRQ